MAVAIRLEGNTLILDDNGTTSSVDLTALKGEKGDMGVRGAQGAPGSPSVKYADLTEEQKAELYNTFTVSAIDTTETQTVTKTEDKNIAQFDGDYYKYDDGSYANYMVKSNRSNYTINGEPAELITIPAMVNHDMGIDYPETTGLESTNWKMAYYPNDNYSGVVWVYKSMGYYDSQIHVGYDEEDTVTTTSLDTPLADILTAYAEGKTVLCKWAHSDSYTTTLQLTTAHSGWEARFSAIYDNGGTKPKMEYINYSFEGITSGAKLITATATTV